MCFFLGNVRKINPNKNKNASIGILFATNKDDKGDDLYEEFKKFYEKEQSLQEEKNIRENLERISIKNYSLDDETDDIINTNKFELQNLNTI